MDAFVIRSPPDCAERNRTETPVDSDGSRVVIYRRWMPPEEASALFARSRREVAWERDTYTGGRRSSRQVQAWGPGIAYSYSGAKRVGTEWPEWGEDVRARVEVLSEHAMNYCLLNRYGTGEQISWHSDSERGLVEDAPIACLSLGATRELGLKPKRGGRAVYVPVRNGDLYVMYGETQRRWLHCIKHGQEERISLTFRCFSI